MLGCAAGPGSAPHMTLLIGALTMGLVLSLLALGVFISFRIFEFADITGEGSITLGAALASVLLVHGVHPVPATAAALVAGALAGTATGVMHTRDRKSTRLNSSHQIIS